jgi:protein-S-isoprenylcysteine O-methyltransferase Ste14
MRIPALGRRGEGWVAGQAVLLAGIGLAGIRDLLEPRQVDGLRLVMAALGVAAIVAGVFIAARAARDLGASLTPFPRPGEANQLVETGVYGLVRHPIYSAIVLAGLGWSAVAVSPLAAILSGVLLAWFDLKSRREEQWLGERHGTYRDYARRTRRFIPRIY